MVEGGGNSRPHQPTTHGRRGRRESTKETIMRHIRLDDMRTFKDAGFAMNLVHDSENFKIINFNFKAGQELPVHSHDIDGELAITVIEGEGEFLGADGAAIPAKQGDMLVSEIRVPHGVRAKTEMRVVVVIAPPI
jgi:quercetin dioxygenase-like cupin family protein